MKRIIFSLLTLLISISSLAYDFEVDGIYYNYNSSNMSASVTSGDKEYVGTINIPSSVSYNGRSLVVSKIEEAFTNCTELFSLTIPSSITSINGFNGCTGLKRINSDTDGVFNIPASVEQLKGFYGCKRLKKLNVPYGATEINGFNSCDSLKYLTLPNSLKTITGFAKCLVMELILPNTVKSIGDHSFQNCKYLNSVVAEGLENIGSCAFSICDNLKRFNSNIDGHFNMINAKIEPWAFSFEFREDNLKDAFGIFASNKNVKHLSLGKETKIPNYFLLLAPNLKYLSIPESVSRLEYYSIGESLDSLIFENSNTSCYNYRALSLPHIKYLYLGRKIENANSYSCNDNSLHTDSLDVLVLGNESALSNRFSFNGKTLISFLENPPSLESKSLDISNYSFANATLYVPQGTKTIYENTGGWKNFFIIKEGIPTNNEEHSFIAQCSTPSIIYNEGSLYYQSSTEGAKFYSTITSPDFKSGESEATILEARYDISVFAAAEGYRNSETATATLYWLKDSGSLDNMTNINTSKMRGIIASSNDGTITLSGLKENEQVKFYTLEGIIIGQTRAINGIASYATSANQTIIAKFGNSNIKILVK